jgi:hypothetical protein
LRRRGLLGTIHRAALAVGTQAKEHPNGMGLVGEDQIIPVGRQAMRVSARLIADYKKTNNPVVIAERVWIERRGDAFFLHVGPTIVLERPPISE